MAESAKPDTPSSKELEGRAMKAEAEIHPAPAVVPGSEPVSTPKKTPTEETKSEQAIQDEPAIQAVAKDVRIVINNNRETEKAIAELRKARARIDSLIGPPFWHQIRTHKVLIVTVFLTLLGMAGSALGLVAGYASEKDRAAYVLAGSLLSLVGNTVSSATGIFVHPPTLGGTGKTTTLNTETSLTLGTEATKTETTA